MANALKTTVLLAALTGVLVFIGDAWAGQQGMIMALIFAAVMNFSAYWFSDRIVLTMYRAQAVSPAEAPELHSVVDNLVMRAGLPKPRVYVIPTGAPNAFATGRDPQHAAVAVTDGILRLLNRDELEAVLGHELGHVRNRDILISSIAATVGGAIMMIANMARWAAIFGGVGRRDDRDGEGGIALLATIIVAPIAAMLIQFAISRSREYQADATGAELSGKPLALASALMKLERGVEMVPMDASPTTAHMFIVNPLTARSALGVLGRVFSTHPATEQRVARLEAMAAKHGPYITRRDW